MLQLSASTRLIHDMRSQVHVITWDVLTGTDPWLLSYRSIRTSEDGRLDVLWWLRDGWIQ